jgi:predicted transcriptional regulator
LSYRTINILDHPARRRIYEHLLRLPGDHFRAIVRSLRLSVGVVRHHLGALVRGGLVYAQRAAGRVRYYPRGGAVAAQLAKLYEKHWKYRDLRFRVLLSVHAFREATPAKVALSLGISRQLAAYHLSRLAKRGQIVRADGVFRSRPGSRPGNIP